MTLSNIIVGSTMKVKIKKKINKLRMNKRRKKVKYERIPVPKRPKQKT